MEQQTSLKTQREPNPKRLIVTLMIVAFFGGSCSIQRMMGGEGEIPEVQEVSQAVEKQAGFPAEMTPEQRQNVVAAAHQFLEKQVRLSNSLQAFNFTFGLLLAAAYSFVLVIGMRALTFFPGSARQLSFVSVLVLPARVAIAALDMAMARSLQPAMEALFQALAEATSASSGLSAEETARVVQSVGQGASWLLVGMQLLVAIAICGLFYYAWRYFQRPEVLALYERRAPPPA